MITSSPGPTPSAMSATSSASVPDDTPTAWAVPLDIAPDHAGVVTGWMNTLGNLGGLLGPLVVGFVVEEYRSWVVPFYIAAGMYVVGALAWLAIDPNTLIEPPAIAADA